MIKKLLLRFLQVLLICSFVLLVFCSCNNKKGDLLLSGISESGLVSITNKNEILLSSNNYEDRNLAETTYNINLYGEEYTGIYQRTIIYPYYRCAVDKYECWEDGRFILSFLINRYSKQLMSFRFSVDNYYCATDKNTGKSYEECRQIAIQKLYEYDRDSVFTEKEVQDDYLKNIYKFMFVKTIDGVESSARIIVSVNTDGVIVRFDTTTMPSFNNIETKEQRLKNIDESNLNEQIESKLSEILKGENYEKWEIYNRTLHILKDGSPCIEYDIRVILNTYEVEVEGSIEKAENRVGLRFIKML